MVLLQSLDGTGQAYHHAVVSWHAEFTRELNGCVLSLVEASDIIVGLRMIAGPSELLEHLMQSVTAPVGTDNSNKK